MEQRPSAPEGAKRKNGTIGQGFQRHPAGYDTPKKLTKGEKRVAPSPPEDRIPKKGKGSNIAHLRCGHRRPDPTEGWGIAAGVKKEKRGSCAPCAGTYRQG